MKSALVSKSRIVFVSASVGFLLATLLACWRPTEYSNNNNETSNLPPAHLSSVPLSYADVVSRVAPAVVTVHTSRRVRAPEQFPFFDDNFLRQLFGGSFGRRQQQPAQEVERTLGSGVIVRSDGHILTNQHVIDGAEEIKVDLNNHQSYTARVVGSDPPSDLAVLKINADNLPVLSLADSDKVRVGDICLAIGNPLGVGETVTSGIVSAKGRQTGLSTGSFQDFLQTDAPINQGNSGGALVNTTGALIGINSQIISTTGGSIGLGFAIPSNMARTVMDQLIKRGKVERGHLGVGVQTLTSGLADSLGVKGTKGVVVTSVEPGSPAASAGLKSGDVITALNGNTVDDPNTFRNSVAGMSPGTAITLTVVRDGQQQQMHATLNELSNQPANRGGESGQGGTGGKLGITLEPLTPDIAGQLGIAPGMQGVVVANVDPNGPAADSLQPGDVIMQVNRQPVRSVADVQAALAKGAGHPALLLVNRGGQTFFVAIQANG